MPTKAFLRLCSHRLSKRPSQGVTPLLNDTLFSFEPFLSFSDRHAREPTPQKANVRTLCKLPHTGSSGFAVRSAQRVCTSYQEKKRKVCTLRCQFDEKPSVTPGCPGYHTNRVLEKCSRAEGTASLPARAAWGNCRARSSNCPKV